MFSPFSLRDPDNLDGDAEPARSLRPVGATAAAVVAAVVAAAVILPMSEAAASSPAGRDAHGAQTTVRDFLTSAVVDGQTYAACQYLTPAEQARVAALEGAGATCTQTLTSSPAGLFGLSTNDGVARLSLRASVRAGRADVTASVSGRVPVTFLLTETTPADLGAFQAPATGWRIAGGATQLFGAHRAVASPTVALT